ncbi:MAG: transposase [Peptococcaceae bacterium]|nr:transposase [Peptococcaceae bacterium]
MVTKVNVNQDLRRFCLPHRNTRNWELLYDKRTSVERSFARLKEHLTANDLHVRGVEKVKSYIFLNAIILLSSALAIKNTNSSIKKTA